MEKRSIVYKDTSTLIPYVGNSRTHSDEQVKQIAASIQEFGFTNPILIDENNSVIAGHGRMLAAELIDQKEIPCIVLAGLTKAQQKALVIADNQLALNADWDLDKLTLELESLAELDFDVDLLGFDDDFLENLLAPEENEGLTDEDAVPEPPEDPVTVLGDIWTLGDHRLMCGDSTSIDAVEQLMDGQKAVLIHADPPYGMGKEKDGVLNDNLYSEKLDNFQMDWWVIARSVTEDNGSAYIWGNAKDLWRLWYSKIEQSERLTFRNEIVWNKSAAQGMSSPKYRCYPCATERCLFFVVGEQGHSNNADNYWEGFEPIRGYLLTERNKMGWNNKKVADFFGFVPSMAGHWFGKSQWSFITEEHYTRLQSEAQNQAFQKDYQALKDEFYSTRAFFDNTHQNMTDVISAGSVTGSDRHGHATPKPVEMLKTLIKSSAPISGVVLEPFGGSGSTLIACEAINRHCRMLELAPEYCDVIIKRWEEFTGQDAVHADTGMTYKETCNV